MQVTDPAGTAESRKEGPRSTVARVGIVVPFFGMRDLQHAALRQLAAGQPPFWTALEPRHRFGFLPDCGHPAALCYS